jgi:hypothetical protein
MKTLLVVLFTLTSYVAMAAPFIVSDPYPLESSPQPTHCGIWLNTASKVEMPITAGPAGVYCKYDVGTVSVGSNTIKMSHIYRNPVDPWGDLESPQSSPFTFSRPSTPSAPTGQALSK